MSKRKRLILGSALIGVAIVLIALGFMFELKASDWASWVQAIGSMIAIGVTGWAVNYSHKLSADKAAKDATADEVRRLSAIASCIFHCRAEAESLMRHCYAYKPSMARELELLGRPVQLLQSVSVLEIPDWQAAVAVGQAMSMYSYLVGALGNTEEIRAGALSMTEDIQERQRKAADQRVGHCKDAIAKFEECERTVQTALKERGADVPQQQVQFADGFVRSVSVSVVEA